MSVSIKRMNFELSIFLYFPEYINILDLSVPKNDKRRIRSTVPKCTKFYLDTDYLKSDKIIHCSRKNFTALQLTCIKAIVMFKGIIIITIRYCN